MLSCSHTCTHKHTFTLACLYMHNDTLIITSVCTHSNTQTHKMHTFALTYSHSLMFISSQLYADTLILIHTHTFTVSCIVTYLQTYTYSLTHTLSHSHVHSLLYSHTLTNTYSHTTMYIVKHTHPHMHSNTHSHTHSNTLTHIFSHIHEHSHSIVFPV